MPKPHPRRPLGRAPRRKYVPRYGSLQSVQAVLAAAGLELFTPQPEEPSYAAYRCESDEFAPEDAQMPVEDRILFSRGPGALEQMRADWADDAREEQQRSRETMRRLGELGLNTHGAADERRREQRRSFRRQQRQAKVSTIC